MEHLRGGPAWAAFLSFVLALPSAAGAQTATGASTTTGVSRAFNPAISLNGLFLVTALPGWEEEPEEAEADHEGHHHGPAEGVDVQEVELRFTADIDPYSKADATLAFHGEEIHWEEIFVSSRILPGGLGLRGGRFYVDATGENTLHTHQYPFVRRSLIDGALFAEPWSDVGLELSWLAPLDHYVELRAAAVDGREPGFFEVEGGPRSLEGGDLAYNANLNLLFDLSPSTTLGASGRWTLGPNSLGPDALSQIVSASATLRWVPTRTQLYRDLRLHAEWIHADRDALDPEEAFFTSGWYASAQYRLSRRWWAQGRWDTLERSSRDGVWIGEATRRATVGVAFVPSEFQALRLEWARVEGPDDEWSEIYLQYNFTVGSHPAHRY